MAPRDALTALAQPRQRVAHDREIGLAALGQFQRAVAAAEQLEAEERFERLGLMADRRRRQVQLLCRPLERQRSRRGLEGFQRVQRGQAAEFHRG